RPCSQYRAWPMALSRSPAAMALALVPHLEEGLALLSRQHVAGILQGLGEALGGVVSHLHLLLADRLDTRRIDGRRLQGRLHRLAVLGALVVQGAHVLEGVLEDAGDLLLLLGRGIGAVQRTVDALVDARLELRRIGRLAVGLCESDAAGGGR